MTNTQHHKPRQILICEPDEMVRSLLAEVLMEVGYDVRQRDTTPDIASLQKDAPDLLVLDLPRGSQSPQLELIHRLKVDTQATHIPILVLCKALPSTDVASWTRQKGVAGLLLKPFDLDDFQESVEAALSTNTTRTSTGHMDSQSKFARYQPEYRGNMDSHPGS